jgi:hypothetical protein
MISSLWNGTAAKAAGSLKDISVENVVLSLRGLVLIALGFVFQSLPDIVVILFGR